MRKRAGKDLICKTCGKSFYVKPSRVATSLYCSLSCRKPWNTGLSIDDERVKVGVLRASKANVGKKNPKAYFLVCKGKIFGKNHWNWKGGVHKKNYSERCAVESTGLYRKLKLDTLKRDSFTCGICGKRGGRLDIHHIKPWSLYTELRFDINNLITLCRSCHRKTDTWGNRINNG